LSTDGLCDQSIRADGTKVSAGQTLVSINNSDLKAKKAQADANILQATAGYNNAKKDYDRFVTLFKQQSASQKNWMI
jgi:multidrug resistance efflux pump